MREVEEMYEEKVEQHENEEEEDENFGQKGVETVDLDR